MIRFIFFAGIHCFAEAHVCESLAELAKNYALEHFAEVAQHDEVLMLSRSKLIEIIQSDDLLVASEDVVFQAVIDWVTIIHFFLTFL